MHLAKGVLTASTGKEVLEDDLSMEAARKHRQA